MTKHQINVEKTIVFFNNNDVVLGFRKMLDCAMDTQDMGIYQKAIKLTDLKETKQLSQEELITKCKALLQEIAEVNVTEVDTDNKVIIAKNITKTYGSRQFSLGPVSLQITKGQVYGLVGENGNGKTTLLRILAKELSYDTGELDFRFSKVPKNDFELRSRLIYIPQRTEKWYGSLKDNLKFVLANYGISPEENETRTLLMIARLGLWNYKHLKWSELSSGYKMRFELARTLLRQPEILLLDEPLANLDVLAQQVILEDLKAIANSVNNPIALILSSQQLFEVEKISDNVIFLKNGQYKDGGTDSENPLENQLIIEIDTDESREKLQEVFATFSLEKINYNGGIYVVYFSANTSFSSVITAIGTANIQVTYLRNISSSTRRFFVS